jgi:hypothetical protein
MFQVDWFSDRITHLTYLMDNLKRSQSVICALSARNCQVDGLKRNYRRNVGLGPYGILYLLVKLQIKLMESFSHWQVLMGDKITQFHTSDIFCQFYMKTESKILVITKRFQRIISLDASWFFYFSCRSLRRSITPPLACLDNSPWHGDIHF